MKTPTVKELKKWAAATKPLAKTVCLAMAFAEVKRERVDAYVEPLFKTFEFYNDFAVEHGEAKERLTKSKDLYLSSDEEKCKAFYAACDKAHREHGFDGPEGYCPALVAEDLLRKAERALLAEVGNLMAVDGDDFARTLELRKKTLDWALGVCLGKLT